MKLQKFFLVGSLFLSVLLPFAAAAISYAGFGGYPAHSDPNDPRTLGWFIYHLAPGEKKQDAVKVVNNTGGPLDVYIYPADSIRSSDGGFALKQMGDTQIDLGSWVTLYDVPPKSVASSTPDILTVCAREAAKPEKKQRAEIMTWCQGTKRLQVHLDPVATTAIPFVIAIPEKVDVGEHTGGILIQKIQTQPGSGGLSGVSISTRIGVRIYETVPGAISKELTLSGFTVIDSAKDNLIRAMVRIRNSGNVSVDAQLKLVIDDPLFKKNRQVITKDVQVLRGDELVTNMEIPRPKIGYLKIYPTVSYTDANNGQHELNAPPVKLPIVPWPEVALIGGGIVLVAAGATVWFLLRKRKYSTAMWVEYAVSKDDTIVKLAKTVGLPWKFLAVANKLKPPYVLEPGQTLRLPFLPDKTAAGKQKKITPKQTPKQTL